MTVVTIKEKPPAGFLVEQKGERLSESVRQALKNYFSQLKGEEPKEVYRMVLEIVEASLFEAVMKYTRQNQFRTAALLGLSRGNVREKLKAYGIL